MLHSCGALLHTISPSGVPGVILGTEGYDGKFLPFKGCPHIGETYEQAACREIAEETCGIVRVNQVDLWNNFTTKHKHYHMGLIFVDYSILDQFDKVRRNESRHEFLEKKEIKFFPLHNVLEDDAVHNISKISIKFYWDTLWMTANQSFPASFSRCQGVRKEYAKQVFEQLLSEQKIRPRISPPRQKFETLGRVPISA